MLTFDDGPLPGWTDRALEVLARLKGPDGQPLRAAFFIVGDAPRSFWQRHQYYAPYEIWQHKGSMCRHAALVREVQAAHHWIGCHTNRHGWLHWPWLNRPAAIARDLVLWEETARETLAAEPVRLLRPPYLIVTQALRQTAAGLDYQLVLGETFGDANPLLTADAVRDKALRLLQKWPQQAPCVLAFHDTCGLTRRSLGEILQGVRDAGFVPVHFDPMQAAVPSAIAS